MKLRKWMIGFMLIWMTGLLNGQGVSILEVRGGYLNPKGTDPGLIFGGSYGISFDERVDISLGVSYFHKNYLKDTEIADTDYVSGVHEVTVVRELEYKTTLLPISANLNIRLPFQPPLYWCVGGSLTYQFLFNTEHNFEENIKEKRNYSGFGWMARAGIEYNIGSRSSLLIEAFYNSCKVKGNKEKKQGLPVWDEVDVSGLGFRGGVRLYFY